MRTIILFRISWKCNIHTSSWDKTSQPHTLLTLAFVTCSTNAREGLVKLIMCNDVPGHWVDMWRCGTFLEKLQVSECTINHKHRP